MTSASDISAAGRASEDLLRTALADHEPGPALNSGVPATDVAERAGHSVEVLLRVYATAR